MVSARSSSSRTIEVSTRDTFFAFWRSTGWSKPRICRTAICRADSTGPRIWSISHGPDGSARLHCGPLKGNGKRLVTPRTFNMSSERPENPVVRTRARPARVSRRLVPHCPAFFDNCQVPLPDDLPPIPTATIGSYALPGWYQLARDHVSRGELAETVLRELVEDASTVALSDQEHAGLDVVSDGEVRPADFIMGFYSRLDGLR